MTVDEVEGKGLVGKNVEGWAGDMGERTFITGKGCRKSGVFYGWKVAMEGGEDERLDIGVFVSDYSVDPGLS